jgi:hypothetical protein
VPTAAEGDNGDMTILTSTWDVYHKVAGAWVLQGNIQGADGAVSENLSITSLTLSEDCNIDGELNVNTMKARDPTVVMKIGENANTGIEVCKSGEDTNIMGTLTVDEAVTFSATSSQLVLGTTDTVTITAPVPAASRTLTIPDPLAAARFFLYPTGSAVTQATSTTTGVTLSTNAGTITCVSSTLAAVTTESFTVTNTLVASTSNVIACVENYSGTMVTNGIPYVTVATVGSGSFILRVTNVHASNALSGIVKIAFIVC